MTTTATPTDDFWSNIIQRAKEYGMSREKQAIAATEALTAAFEPQSDDDNPVPKNGIEKDWTGAASVVLNILKAEPSKIFTYAQLAAITGYTSTQVQCSVLHLTRSGEFVSRPRKGTVRWTPEFQPTQMQMKQIVFLYEDLYENSVQGPDDPYPVYRGGIIRALSNRTKKYFRINGKFSKNATMTAFRLLVRLDCVAYESDTQFYKKYLMQNPYEALGLPTPTTKRGRPRKNVPQPLKVSQVPAFTEPDVPEAKEAEWKDVDLTSPRTIGEIVEAAASEPEPEVPARGNVQRARNIRAAWVTAGGEVRHSPGFFNLDEEVEVAEDGYVGDHDRYERRLAEFVERHPTLSYEVIGTASSGNKLIRTEDGIFELTPI